jgi:hypothetical protein
MATVATAATQTMNATTMPRSVVRKGLRNDIIRLDIFDAAAPLPRPGHPKIRIPRAALRAPQPACPHQHSCRRAVLFGQRRRVGLEAMQTRLAPDDQADPSRDGLAEG